MAEIVIRTKHWPEAKGKSPDYWLAWANGVQSDGVTEVEAIKNANQAHERREPVDSVYEALLQRKL